MTKDYCLICDHEMLVYCAIFKGLGTITIIGSFLDGIS
jgi:hypothetical protein